MFPPSRVDQTNLETSFRQSLISVVVAQGEPIFQLGS
jgi:hypothetical protein